MHGAQKLARTIDKKVGWVASSIFTRLAGCGLPLAAMASLLYDPIKRRHYVGYAENTKYSKQLCGDLITMTFGTAQAVVFGSWMPTEIDLETTDEKKSEEFILECLKAGANPHYREGNLCGISKTPLGTACSRGHVEVVKVLIDAGVNVNCPVIKLLGEFLTYEEKMPPLEVTLFDSRIDFVSHEERAKRTAIFKALLAAGAIIHDGSSLLNLAISRECEEIVDLLLNMRFRHFIYNEMDLALRFNLPHRIPHAVPEGFDVSMLRDAIVAGSWEAVHLFWKRFRKEIRTEGTYHLLDTLIGAILETYLKDIVVRFVSYRARKRDLGQIGPFLREALSKELPSERERLRLKELMDKVMHLGRRPQDTVFFICAFLFPEDYPEWIKIFPSKEPGKKEAIAAIESTYQVVVKNYVEKEKVDHFSKGSLLDLSDIVRSYIFSETHDPEKRALRFLDNDIRITIQDL